MIFFVATATHTPSRTERSIQEVILPTRTVLPMIHVDLAPMTKEKRKSYVKTAEISRAVNEAFQENMSSFKQDIETELNNMRHEMVKLDSGQVMQEVANGIQKLVTAGKETRFLNSLKIAQKMSPLSPTYWRVKRNKVQSLTPIAPP